MKLYEANVEADVNVFYIFGYDAKHAPAARVQRFIGQQVVGRHPPKIARLTMRSMQPPISYEALQVDQGLDSMI
jgi:hypothetical protein